MRDRSRPRYCKAMLAVLATALAVLTLAGFGTRIWPSDSAGLVAELASSFRHHYLWISVILAVATTLVRMPRSALLATSAVLINLPLVGIYYLAPPSAQSADAEAPELRIVHFNAQSRATSNGFEAFARFVNDNNPHLVAIADLSSGFALKIETELPSYEPVLELPIDQGGGMGLYSRISVEDARLRYFAPSQPGLASLVASIEMNGEIIDLIMTHPIAPTSPASLASRNEQLANIASERDRFAKNLVVIGDLNVTSWSWAFSDLVTTMKLKDTRRGFGIQGTWPAIGMRIPIDHCLVSEGFVTTERRLGPNSGSQHLPIFVALRLKND